MYSERSSRVPYAAESSRDAQLINHKNQGWALLMIYDASHSFDFIQTPKGLGLPDRCSEKFWCQPQEGIDVRPQLRRGNRDGLHQAPPQGEDRDLLQNRVVQHRRQGQAWPSDQAFQTNQQRKTDNSGTRYKIGLN